MFNMLLMLYFNQYKSDHQYFNGPDHLTLVGVVIGAEHVVIFFKLLCETYIPDRTKWLVEALDG